MINVKNIKALIEDKNYTVEEKICQYCNGKGYVLKKITMLGSAFAERICLPCGGKGKFEERKLKKYLND